MQQRRGTAAQWTAANPVLAAGEIGFETDTSKFKMGNGSSAWTALTYFANAAELAAIIDGAPEALNTLNELAAALGDNPAFLTGLDSSIGTVSDAVSVVEGNLTTHNSATTSVHGIADTSDLVTQENLTDAINAAEVNQSALAGVGIDWNSVDSQFDIDSTVATKTYADDAIGTHNSDSTSVHGIANTADLATKSYADDAIGAHNSATTSVHGIADTSDLVTQENLTDAINAAEVNQSALAGVGIDWNSVDSQFDIDSTVATKTYADDAVTDHNDLTQNIHGIADTSLLATTADVAAVTKTTLGLGNVDNTSDANKPVSTATVTAIATAKSEAIAEVTAVIDGAPNALNTLNELAAALGDDANFAGTVTTALAAKVDSYTPITQKTASYTLSTLNHRDDLIEMGSASALTLTIPLNSSIAYPVGTSLDILQTGAGQVTIAGAAGVTVNATPGLKLRTQWSSATLFKRAENTWVVYGDLTA